jgi:hypothetical protein
VARLSKATNLPSALIAARNELLLACPPAASVLTRVTVPVIMSLTKTSRALLVSPATRLEAVLSKAT